MKILLFIETLHAGGKERRLVELIKGLSKDKSIQLELVITKEGIHYEDIYATGIKIHYAVRKFFKKDPRVFYKIYKIVRKMKPDIIHVWGNVSAIYATPIKIITRTYMINNQITDAPSKVSNSLLSHRLTFPFSDKIVSNSKAGLKAYNAPKEKSLVIYNGFDFNRITNIQPKESIRSKFNINTKYVIGMVATFYEMKDYATYIKAANGILKNNKEITFLCIGAGDDSSTKALVDPENIDNILFLGKQNNVESIMNVCDIGVLATFTEGISNSLLEFMSLKKPIVITGGGGCAELIEHNANGYLLEQGDHIGLAARIVDLIDDEKLAIGFGNRSKKIVEEKFDIDKMIKGYKELYSSIKLT